MLGHVVFHRPRGWGSEASPFPSTALLGDVLPETEACPARAARLFLSPTCRGVSELPKGNAPLPLHERPRSSRRQWRRGLWRGDMEALRLHLAGALQLVAQRNEKSSSELGRFLAKQVSEWPRSASAAPGGTGQLPGHPPNPRFPPLPPAASPGYRCGAGEENKGTPFF